MIPKLLGETTRRTRPDVVDRVRSLVLANSADAIAGAVRALMTRPDSTPLLSTIHFPTLIVVGDEDTVTPPPLAEKMHRSIAGSELTVIAGAGHLSNLEQPEVFNGALARFLEPSAIVAEHAVSAFVTLCIVRLRCSSSPTPAAQESLADSARRKTFDQLLDLYVRNGDVYYRALKAERAKLDGFVNLQATTAVDKLSRDEQLAFWLNAYNALVLKTVIDHYPIAGKSSEYPAKSIRQISGAFERLPHRVAGRTLTLDQIEQTVLAGFQDPRVFFALGRGAVGSGRLRSEAFAPARSRSSSPRPPRSASRAPSASTSIAKPARSTPARSSRGARRSSPRPTPTRRRRRSRAAARSNARSSPTSCRTCCRARRSSSTKNTFQLVYMPFDWTLNDLTGRGGR